MSQLSGKKDFSLPCLLGVLPWVAVGNALLLGTGTGCLGAALSPPAPAAWVKAARGGAAAAAAAALGGASTLLSLCVPGVLLGLRSNPARPRQQELRRGSSSGPRYLDNASPWKCGEERSVVVVVGRHGCRVQPGSEVLRPCFKGAGRNLAELGGRGVAPEGSRGDSWG